MNLTHPQLDTLRSCINRADGDVAKGLEVFKRDYVHASHRDAHDWETIAAKIKADPEHPEKWLQEQRDNEIEKETAK